MIDTTSEQVRYDNAGIWGDQTHLDRIQQLYAVAKARLDAGEKCHQVTEQDLAGA